MENTQPTTMADASESQADTLDASTKLELVADTEKSESENLSQTTNVDMPSGSIKTWTNAELEKLKSKAGLVAGALSEFQDANGLVAVTEIEYKMPSGRVFTATKIILVADGLNMKVERTSDGLDFDAILPLG